MDVFDACVYLGCIFITILWPLSLTDGFSVALKPSEGYNEGYTDVTFTGTVISLTCAVENIDIDDTNTSIYLNDLLIFQSEERFKLINGIRFFRNIDDNAYKLQVDNVTIDHGGNYTCVVNSHGVTEGDSFILKVVSDSPQCITHCNDLENSCQFLCYSRPMAVEEYFTWEEFQDGIFFEGVHSFFPLSLGDKTVAILNTSYSNVFKNFKCSIEKNTALHTQLVGFCEFPFLMTTRPSYRLQTDQESTSNNIPINENVSMKTQTDLVEANLTITSEMERSGTMRVPVGVSCALFLAVAFSFIFVCIVARRKQKSFKCRARAGAHQTMGLPDTSCVHGGCQAENMLSTSPVHVPVNHHILHLAGQTTPIADSNGDDILSSTDPQEHIYYEITTDETTSNIGVIDKYEENKKCVDKQHAHSVLNIVEKEKCDCNRPLSIENSPKQRDTKNKHIAEKMRKIGEMVDNLVYEECSNSEVHDM